MMGSAEGLDADALECLYQLINYADESDEALLSDARLRYGDSYMDVCGRAREALSSLGEGAGDLVRRFYGLLADRAMGRARGLGDASSALARYMGLGGPEDVLRVQFRLMGFGEGVIEDLIRAGVLMHRSRGVLFVPEYLIPRLLEISSNLSAPEVREVLSNADVKELLVIEAAAFGVKPIDWLFRAIYGSGFRELVSGVRVDGLLDGSLGKPVLNPMVDVGELRAFIHEIKDSGARSLRRALGPHGQYMYSRVARCGVVYTVFGEGGRELILLCPWILPSRGFLNYHSREDRVVVANQSPSQDFVDVVNNHIHELPTRTGFVFISGREALVYKPQSYGQSFDSFLDFLYRSNFVVTYLN